MTEHQNGILKMKRGVPNTMYCFAKGCTNKPVHSSFLCQKHIEVVLNQNEN